MHKVPVEGLALGIIAAVAVTGPGVLWPDLRCTELLPLPSSVLSDFHFAPPGPLRVRCVRWCLKLGNRGREVFFTILGPHAQDSLQSV